MPEGDINLDTEDIRSVIPSLMDLAGTLQQAGSTLKEIHAKVKQAVSGDESGAVKAIEEGAETVTGAVGDGLAEGSRVIKGVGERLHSYSGSVDATEADITDHLHGVNPDEDPGTFRGGNGSGDEGGGHGPGDGPGGHVPEVDPVDPRKAQEATPTTECTKAGEPVDVISGQLIMPVVDLALEGLLPLRLYRVYCSQYRLGRWFGASYASTLDQCVELTADGLKYCDEDGAVLYYPLPSAPGERVLPDAGARWSLRWDRADELILIEDPDSGLTRGFSTAAAGSVWPVTSLTDRNGHGVVYQREDSGAPRAVVHSCGYRVEIDLVDTPAGRRVGALRVPVDAAGERTGGEGGTVAVSVFGYDDAGRLTSAADESGVPQLFEYDDRDRLTAWIDRLGFRYGYAYDDRGRVIAGTGDEGVLSSRFDYDEAARVTTVTDSLGQPMQYHYNRHYRVVRTVDAVGGTCEYEFDPLGRRLAATDEIGRTTRYQYDEDGQIVRVIRPDGSELRLGYTALGQVQRVVDRGRQAAEFSYDERGNLVAFTDQFGLVERRGYDPMGRITSVTDPAGHTRTFSCNAAGLVTGVTDAAGRTSATYYDAYGRVVAITDPHGATEYFRRALDGNLLEWVRRDNTRETYAYDLEGNLVEHCDAIGAVTRWRRGPFAKVLERVNPDGDVHRYRYDTEQQLVEHEHGGAVWSYRYDAAGHMIGETDYNGRTLTYRRDAADQLLEIDDGHGRVTGFGYNELGELTFRRNADGTVTEFSYDEQGRTVRVAGPASVIEYRYDEAGRLAAESVDGFTVSYGYDEIGRRVTRTLPSGVVSTLGYDQFEQPAALSVDGNRLGFEYDLMGREVARYLGAGAVLSQSWDTAGRLSSQTLWSESFGGPASPVQQRGYRYRPDNMPEAVTDVLRGTREFELTASGRVTQVRADAFREDYAYDALGNIIQASDTRMAGHEQDPAGERSHRGTLLERAGRTTFEYDERERLVSRTVRTLSGSRLVWRYTWNDMDQLVRVETPHRGSWTYSYDPYGRRVGKQRLDAPAGEAEHYRFVWDDDRLTEQMHTDAAGRVRTTSWDYLPGAFQPVSQTERIWQGSAGQSEYDELFFAVVTDQIGALAELVTPDGRVAWAANTTLWGRRLAPSVPAHGYSPLGLPGQYHDEETGLAYNLFRYYDPATGRYLSSDPLGQQAGPNPHGYVPNPMVWLDPYGLLGTRPKTRVPSGEGGWYKALQPANFPASHPRTSTEYEINHIPPQDAYLGIMDLGKGSRVPYGPAIRMEYDDHRALLSTGSGHINNAYRAAQRTLIQQGKFDEAMKMDIDDIRSRYGSKYDAAIDDMVKSLPKNTKLQDALKAKGWKIRYCLLK